MKKMYLLLTFLCFTILLQAQASNIWEVTARNLNTLVTDKELSILNDFTITGETNIPERGITEEVMQAPQDSSLVLTGMMNAADLRALTHMTSVTEVDMSAVTIIPFHTVIMRYDMYYPENVIGCNENTYTYYSFKNMLNLTSIVLPATVTKIESSAFEFCAKLKQVVLPSSLIYLGHEAFRNCKALTSIQIPSSVISAGYGLFSGCSSLTSIELPEGITSLGGTFANCSSLRNIDLPASIKIIGSDTFLGCVSLSHLEMPPMVAEISARAFKGCRSLRNVIIPPAVTIIPTEAFAGCVRFTSISIPSQVTTIGSGAFAGCSSLDTIYAYPALPPQKEVEYYESAFLNVDKTNCLLYVPAGSKELYAQAEEWKEFKNIREMEVLRLSLNKLTLEADTGTAAVQVTSVHSWTATSDQPWLTITPAAGTGSSSITITAAANPSIVNRTAIVTFMVDHQAPQIITVLQQGNTAPIELTPGQLSSIYTPLQLQNIERLTIKGTMDARDFKTIRNNMYILTKLDISEATIMAYSGKEGTHDSEFDKTRDIIVDSFTYAANELPYKAFDGYCHQITTVILPPSLTSIGEAAFRNRLLITALDLPSAVNTIGPNAFDGCENLTMIDLPPSVLSIGSGAFIRCKSLKTIVLPPLINQINESLFEGSGLTSISIPSRVNYISQVAFGYCDSLSSIYCYAPNPPELTWPYGNAQVFFNMNKSKCTLYVPYGSKALYAAAPNDWKGFTNTIEMPGIRLSAATIALKATQGDTASVSINANVSWTATSDQSWLTIQPSSGTDDGMLRFTAEANTMEAGRMTTVTVSAPDIVSQTIMVIQQGAPSTIKLTPGSLASAFTAQELSCITHLTITGEMDARDFRVIRAQMPLLTFLDLSAVTINEYREMDSITNKEIIYRAQSIPQNAFFDPGKWKGKASLTTVVLPLQLEKIGDRAFCNATGLTEISIPSTVRFINFSSFNYCPYLKTIISHMQTPPGSYDYGISFYNVDKTACKLYVPIGSKGLYAAAEMWKDFINTIEIGGFELSATELSMDAVPAIQTIQITIEGEWSAVSDKEWLTISPSSGDSTQTVTFTCQENTAFEPRTATVTFSTDDGYSQLVNITQKARINNIPVANAGADQSAEESAVVQLDGSASTDVDGDALTYEWTAPEGITLSSTSDDKPTFTAPKVEKDTIYTLKLVVNDGKDNSVSDKVLVTVTNKTIELGVSAHAVVFESKESLAKIRITGNAQWAALSDQEWLSISPLSGEGQKEITLTVQDNDTPADRVAIVTVSATEVEAQSITITQHGLTTGLEEMTNVMEIKFHPNPFTSEMVVEITNPSLKEVTVEIHSISGQKIRTLARAQKEAKISLNWYGKDDQGKLVPSGIYLLKVNEQVRKVVFGK